MKRIILMMVMIASIAFAGATAGFAQDDELFKDQKDTISIDDMDPVFYEAEEEGSNCDSSSMIVVIVAGVAVILGGAYFFMKKKKK